MDDKKNCCTDSVCIHVNRLYDQCRDKECLENLRVYLTNEGQNLLQNAISVRVKGAEVIWAFSDVEPLPFNKGHYTVDIQIYFKISLELNTGTPRPTEIDGLATYEKKVVLFGSEGNAKVFTSTFREDAFDPQGWAKTNLPKAVVELVDPIALSAKISDVCTCPKARPGADLVDVAAVPEPVARVFCEPLCNTTEGRVILVTLGLFSIVKLEREVQLVVPAVDFCIPCKECVSATEDDPCDLFERIEFPIDEFFPPVCDNNTSSCNDSCDNN